MLQWRAATHPQHIACSVLADTGDAWARLSYRELDTRARAVAAMLQSRATWQRPVLILYPSSLDYIVSLLGCLYAGAIAVPAFPMQSSRTRGRLMSMARDSGARLMLGPALRPEEAAEASRAFGAAPEICTVDTIPDALAGDWRRPAFAHESLALMQYTSGSTTDPRGVMVSHDNLLCSERMIQTAFGTAESSIVAGWLPLFHDMGLIGLVLQPLFAGATTILMRPSAFLQRPVRWLELVTRDHVTISGGPNMAYDLCVDAIPEEQRQGLDLTSWDVAFNGAEPIRRETLDRFVTAFAPYGFRRRSFRPCYGLAEATLLVSSTPSRADLRSDPCDSGSLGRHHARPADPGDPQPRWIVSCGQVASPGEVRIVDAATGVAMPDRQIGEIWVRGPQVARGYWRRPDESASTFQATLAGDTDGSYLRTGDLGYLADGELFVTGRVKDLIVIRGQNHYPQDLEITAASSDPLIQQRPAAVFAVDSHGQERVVVVQEVPALAPADPDRVMTAIRQQVALAHDVPLAAVVLVAPHTIPRTSSGKLRRSACQAAFLAGRLPSLAEWRAPDLEVVPPPRDETAHTAAIDAWLRSWMATTLSWQASAIAPDRPLLQYGLDSLRAMQLAQAIETEFQVEVPIVTLLEGITLADLGSQILQARSHTTATTPPSASPSPEPESFPLSLGQRGIWLQHTMQGSDATYNIASAVRLRTPIQVDALRQALDQLVQRHPSLRTGFQIQDGVPIQRVRAHERAHFVEEQAADLDDGTLGRTLATLAWQPFDLEHDPLLRVRLFRRRAGDDVLLLVVHHLVADLWSLAVLVEELGTIYSAITSGRPVHLPPSGAAYAGHVRQEADRLAAHDADDWTYWRQQLREPLPILDLPIARPLSGPATSRSAIVPFELSDAVTARLQAFAAAHGMTLYMATLACFQLLLHRYSQQQDIVVGSPVSGRLRPDLVRTVGYFVNTLALRARFDGDPTVRDHLARTRVTVLDAFRHQGLPFAQLIERLQPVRQGGLPPVFQAMFILQEAAGADTGLAALASGRGGVRVEAGALSLESIVLDERLSNFPLVLNTALTDGRLMGAFEFQSDRYEAASVARMAAHLQTLLEHVVDDPECRVSQVPMLTPSARAQAQIAWNATQRDWSDDVPLLHAPIDAALQAAPDAVVVVADGEHVTGRALRARSRQLASVLIEAGVAIDDPVAVALPRSVDLVVALLAVLQAGAAYLAIDPTDPPDRIEQLLGEAQARVIVTDATQRSRIPAPAGRMILDVQARATSPVFDEIAWPIAVHPENLAYLLFTSGSTGRPKGVMNTHRGISNRLRWMQDAYPLGRGDRVLQKTPCTFDVSVWEFFWPLRCGATLVLAPAGAHRDPRALADLIAREQVTVLHFVPSMLKAFLQEATGADCQSVRHLVSSGEALPPELPPRWRTCSAAPLHNLYGPTEAAVDVSAWTCQPEPDARVVPIGRPIANTQLYVLDRALQIVPVGLPGELYIGGVGLARGYVRQPALTAASFVPDPFDEKGGRLYRTGDIARYRADGALEFLGRGDHQVKLRGMRVELREIELAIAQHPDVADAAVTLGSGATSDALVAFVIWRDAAAADARGLLTRLKSQLPDHLVPVQIVTLDRLPLSTNGKLDRRALAGLATERDRPEGPVVAPRNPIEQQLTAIWQDVLGLEVVGVRDNFFELGGHSLHIAEVLSRIRGAFQVEIRMGRFFDDPTIEQVALAIRESAA